jgi:hypothetical protein
VPFATFPLYPTSRRRSIIEPPVSAKSRLLHRIKQHLYSIISAAWASSACDRVRPSAFAVFRLIRSSNLVG